ncbi:MAG: hypothetical protein ABGY42_04075, partial [bacterium]
LVAPCESTAERSRCTAARIKALGTYTNSALRCLGKAARRGTAPDAACEEKASGQFAAKWSSAEAKDDCLSFADLDGATLALDSFTLDLESALLPNTRNRCAAAKLSEAARLSKGRAKCFAKALARGRDADAACFGKSTVKFEEKWAKAELRGGCPTTGDVAETHERIEALFSELGTCALPGLAAAPACSPVWRPFSDDSLWNTPIGEAPALDPGSDSYINFLWDRRAEGESYCCRKKWTISAMGKWSGGVLGTGENPWGESIYTATSDDAVRSVCQVLESKDCSSCPGGQCPDDRPPHWDEDRRCSRCEDSCAIRLDEAWFRDDLDIENPVFVRVPDEDRARIVVGSPGGATFTAWSGGSSASMCDCRAGIIDTSTTPIRLLSAMGFGWVPPEKVTGIPEGTTCDYTARSYSLHSDAETGTDWQTDLAARATTIARPAQCRRRPVVTTGRSARWSVAKGISAAPMKRSVRITPVNGPERRKSRTTRA